MSQKNIGFIGFCKWIWNKDFLKLDGFTGFIWLFMATAWVSANWAILRLHIFEDIGGLLWLVSTPFCYVLLAYLWFRWTEE